MCWSKYRSPSENLWHLFRWELPWWLRRNFCCWFRHGDLEELAFMHEGYKHAGWWCLTCMHEVTTDELARKGYKRVVSSYYGAVPELGPDGLLRRKG